VIFGRRRSSRSAADSTRETGQGGSPEEEKRDRREKEARGSPKASGSAGDTCREAKLWRGIARWLVDDSREKQREMREEMRGYI
jgi:hypothetical protein